MTEAEIHRLCEKAAALGMEIRVRPDGSFQMKPPTKSRAMTDAERAAAYRARRVTNTVTPTPETVTKVTKNHENENHAVLQPSSPLSPPTPSPLAPTPEPENAREAEPEKAMEPQTKKKAVRKPSSNGPFEAPTLFEWKRYATGLMPPFVEDEAEKAWNHYESNGWRVGKNPAKDWKACCRTCHINWKLESFQIQRGNGGNGKPVTVPRMEKVNFTSLER